MLFELVSGMDLFSKDVNDDTIVNLADCENLAAWKEPSAWLLDQSFKHANGVSTTQRMVVQDLVRMCPHQ